MLDARAVATLEPEVHQAREGRVAERPAPLELPRHEARVVVRRGGGDARMLGTEGLHDHPAGRVAAAGAPGHLHEELEGTLGGAEVGDVEREVGEQHRDQRHAGHVVTLAHHLRAHEDIGVARLPAPEDASLRTRPLGGVAVQPLHGGERVDRAQRGLDLLRADAERGQRRSPAGGARRRRAAAMMAVMAHQRARRPMPGERHAAVRAGRRHAARRALEVGGEAAAVEEDERLLAAGEVRGERRTELVGQQPRRSPAQTHELDRRQRVGGRPVGQLEEHVAAVTGGLVALGRRRRRGQHHHGAGQAGAHDAHVARVVAQPVLLLVGRVVLLVDDHEAEARQRREDGRARPDHQPRAAVADPPPLVPAFARPEPAVQDGQRVAEAGAHAVHELMRERDLRHEQQHVAPGREGVLGGGEEDLGFPASRDAVQEEGRRVPGRDRRGDGVERGPLGRCEWGPRLCGSRTRRA